MTRRYKPYPAYKPSGIDWLGDVPEHWEVKRTKFTLDRNDGGVWGEGYDSDGTIVLRSTEQTVKGQWRISNPARRVLSKTDYLSAKLISGDLLITKSSGSPDHIGKTSIVTPEVEELDCCFSNFMQRLHPDKFNDSKYLFYILNSPIGREQFNYLSNTTTGLANLNGSVIGGVVSSFPPLPEQKAIADFLDRESARIDAFIEKKERLIELLKEKRTALITCAVTKGLDPNVPMKNSGIERLGKIPEHWEVKRLKHTTIGPLQYGANEVGEPKNGTDPRYIRITDIKEDGSLRDDTALSLPARIAGPYLLQEGDLLFARSGATVGKTFLYLTSWGIAAYAGYLVRARIDMKKAIPKYVHYFAQSTIYWDWINSSFLQATIQNVSAEKYANMLIPLPGVDEQRTIADFLDRETARIDALVAKVEEAIARLQEYRTALITAAVMGKIDVRGKG